MISKTQSAAEQRGFTIIELMIATTVVSFLLLLVTVIMVNIGSLYYKGINQSKVQASARTITDDVSQNFKLEKGTLIARDSADGFTHTFCKGAIRYTFALNRQIGTDLALNQSQHVLWRDTVTSGGAGCPIPIDGRPLNSSLSTGLPGGTNGTELIAARSRLTEFSVTDSGSGIFRIKVKVVSGEDDQLCNGNSIPAGDCSLSTTSTHLSDPGANILCKGLSSGHQFCAAANLTTTVVQRF